MTGRQSTWWKSFTIGAALVVLTLAWVTSAVLALERSEFSARADARRQEVLRLALWRMDSWVAPRLARESARPYFEYLSYYPQERAYTRMLTPIEEGAVLTPSPLLTFREPFITLHFQIDARGNVTSPQVPTSNHRDLAESTVLSTQEIRGCSERLDRIGAMIDPAALRAQVLEAEHDLAMTPDASPQQTIGGPEQVGGDYGQVQKSWTLMEQTKRMNRSVESNEAYGAPQTAEIHMSQTQGESATLPITSTKSDFVRVGSFVPVWVKDSTSRDELFYLRRIDIGVQQHLQGFLVDWPQLRAVLLDEVSDIMPGADLAPRTGPLNAAADFPSTNLATVPATVTGLPPIDASAAGLTPTRLALLIVWAVVLLALSLGAMMLRASLVYGQRRSDFASAVTHELRTPLTTFRLYSEMLADDMVPEPQRRREYLETLRSESARLARLVENVLAYARLEEGRQHTSPRRMSARSLIDDLAPGLARQAGEHGMRLQVTCELDERDAVSADRDSVSRILTNLVDNACKYAAGAADQSIELRAARRDGRIAMTVRDHGPGVSAIAAAKLFAPFQRGKDAGANAASGVGLGLALCRSLARDMGGDLRLLPSQPGEAGAAFVLELPRAAAEGE